MRIDEAIFLRAFSVTSVDVSVWARLDSYGYRPGRRKSSRRRSRFQSCVTSPQVLGKQYSDAATTEAARITAHKFADEIIFRLGGGIPGIAESKIYFVSTRTGHKEIWAMDYDGANQHALTHLGSISLSPR